MNQILGNQLKVNNTVPNSSKKIKIIFFACIFIIILCLIVYFFLKYNSTQKEKIAKSLENKFEIHNLYSNNNNYIAQRTAVNSKNTEPFVIGLLKIDKIGLMYPILSESSDELLEISPCRFYGPMPNETRKFMYCRSQLFKQ